MTPKKEGAMPQAEADAMRLPRVTVDLKIPLWGLASAGAALMWGLVSMWFQLATMSTQMSDMQGLLKANNAATVSLASEQALLKYRIEKLEAGSGK